MPSERLRNERRANGLCRCGKTFAANRKMCEECRTKKTERAKEVRAIRRCQGLCKCGKPSRRGKKMCGTCAKKHCDEVMKAYRRNIELGLCGCGGQPVSGKSACEKCIGSQKMAVYKKREMGICLRCKEPAREGGVLCSKCHSDGARDGGYTTLYRKITVMEAYGGKCVCCGETRIEFLSIDHMNNDGNIHRRELLATKRTRIYPWLVKSGFPEGFQVLCMNCNTAKGMYGICPHERERRESQILAPAAQPETSSADSVD